MFDLQKDAIQTNGEPKKRTASDTLAKGLGKSFDLSLSSSHTKDTLLVLLYRITKLNRFHYFL